MKTVDCPNCGGSGKGDLMPLKKGKRLRGMCSICTGSGQVPDWDYDRLYRMVMAKKDSVQMELRL